MANREYKCSYCEEMFTVTKTEQEVIEEGFVTPPNCCRQCYDMMETPQPEEPYSDADNGL